MMGGEIWPQLPVELSKNNTILDRSGSWSGSGSGSRCCCRSEGLGSGIKLELLGTWIKLGYKNQGNVRR
jgi:hypothetical protein